MEYYTPNDDKIIGYDDSKSIQNAIDVAVYNGVNKVVVPRYNKRTKNPFWTITRAIELPSHITVILDNCHLIMADGVCANIFRNSNVYTRKFGDGNIKEEIEGVKDGRQTDIVIHGEGYAVIDGGTSNGVLEANFKKEDLPTPINNNLIFFKGVGNFEISNITIQNQRWWGININDCAYGEISDIYCEAKNLVPNQDGVHLRPGCHDIIVQRISGVSGDDFVALCALYEFITTKELDSQNTYKVKDIHDVKVSDIIGTSARQAFVALRCQDDNKLYNVTIENAIQSNAGDKNLYPYSANIRVNSNAYYFFEENPMGNVYNLNIKNLITPIHTGFVLCGTVKDSSFENIRQISGWTPFYISGVKIKNLNVKGVRMGKDVKESMIYKGDGLREGDYIEDFNITDVTCENGKELCSLPITDKVDIKINGEKLQ